MLAHINEQLSNIINYELELWTGELKFPYWVGEYQEIQYDYEQNMHEYDFTLTGTARYDRTQLEEDKKKIQKLFADYRTILDDGRSVAISYENSFMIPSQEEDIKREQIHLSIREWGY